MHASRRQQQACVWNAASAGTCVHDHGNRCDLIEINSPEWPPLAACSNAPGISCISADQRARGRPWATAVALSSPTLRCSSSLRRRCAVYSAHQTEEPCMERDGAGCTPLFQQILPVSKSCLAPVLRRGGAPVAWDRRCQRSDEAWHGAQHGPPRTGAGYDPIRTAISRWC